MKGNRIYTLLFALIVSFSLKAQSAQKIKTAVYEYLSAEYNASSGIITIGAKGEDGEFYTFRFSENDKIKNADLLHNQFTTQKTSPTKTIYTKTELIGKKIQIGAIPVGEIDPANPYCCYWIKELSVL